MTLQKPIVINFAGAPGAGKSTMAARVFAELKMRGVNAELINEFAKDKTLEHNSTELNCQEYIFGKQSYKLTRCRDQVDVIVTDSPLFLGLLYNHNPVLDYHFSHTVINVFNSYTNITYFINRVKPYNPAGRNQTEEESDALVTRIHNLLHNFNIPYVEIPGDDTGYTQVMSDITAYLAQVSDCSMEV